MKAIVALLFALTAFSAAAADTVLFEDAGTSALIVTQSQNEGEDYPTTTFKQTSVNYTPIYRYELSEDLTKIIIVKSTTVSVWSTTTEGLDENTDVEAFEQNADQKYDKTWSFAGQGSDFKNLTEEFGSLTVAGCCGSPNLTNLYNLQDGTFVNGVQEGSLIDVRAPVVGNEPWPHRYVGFAYDQTVGEQEGLFYITTVTYFTASGRIEKLHLYGKATEDVSWGEVTDFTAKVESEQDAVNNWGGVTYVELWSKQEIADPALKFSDFSATGQVVLNADAPDTFEIRFKGDTFDREGSTFSANLVGVFAE